MISTSRAVLVLTLACMAMAAGTAAQPSGQFSMAPSDLPDFLYMHSIPIARVKLYYTPHSPMRSKVLFGISAPRGGWVGIGWSPDCKMNGSDAVIGGIGSEIAPPATHSLTFTATPDPSLQAFVNSFSVSSTADQLSTLLTVDRAISGGRVALTGQSVCLIWAYSDSHDLGYHGEQRRGGVPISILAIGGGSGSGNVGSDRGVASLSAVTPESTAAPSVSSSSTPSPLSPRSSPSSLEAQGIIASESGGTTTSRPVGTGTSQVSASVPATTAPTQERTPAIQQNSTGAGRAGRSVPTRVVLAIFVVVVMLRSCRFE